MVVYSVLQSLQQIAEELHGNCRTCASGSARVGTCLGQGVGSHVALQDGARCIEGTNRLYHRLQPPLLERERNHAHPTARFTSHAMGELWDQGAPCVCVM